MRERRSAPPTTPTPAFAGVTSGGGVLREEGMTTADEDGNEGAEERPANDADPRRVDAGVTSGTGGDENDEWGWGNDE